MSMVTKSELCKLCELQDQIEYELSINDQKQNEINLKYREILQLEERNQELENENKKAKELIAQLAGALLADAKSKIEDRLIEKAEAFINNRG